MITIKTLPPFDRWFKKLSDKSAKARIQARIDMLALTGHFGDAKMLENPVCELRFFFGNGYRVYYLQDGDNIVLLLMGGDKTTQDDDIKKAVKLAKAYQKLQEQNSEQSDDK